MLYSPPVFDEISLTVLFEGDAQLIMGVHHDGTLPGNGFTDGFAGYEQKAQSMLLCIGHDLLAIIEEHQHPVTDEGISFNVEIAASLDFVE